MATKTVTVRGRLNAKTGRRGPSTRRKMKRIRNKLGKMQWVFAKGKPGATVKAATKRQKAKAAKSRSSKSSKSGGNRTTKKQPFKIPILTTAGVGLGLWNLWTKLKSPIQARSAERAGIHFVHALTAFWIPTRKFRLEEGGGMTTLPILAGWGTGKALSKVGKGQIGKGIPFISLR